MGLSSKRTANQSPSQLRKSEIDHQVGARPAAGSPEAAPDQTSGERWIRYLKRVLSLNIDESILTVPSPAMRRSSLYCVVRTSGRM